MDAILDNSKDILVLYFQIMMIGVSTLCRSPPMGADQF